MKQKTKKKLRQLSALFLSLVMICALSMTVFAAEENNTAGDSAESSQTASLSGHLFTAYQIFKGTYSQEKGKLSDIEWGANAQNPELQATIAQALGLDAGAELAEILAALETVGDDTDTANKLAAAIAAKADLLGSGQSVVDGQNVGPGYYIVIDTSTELGEGSSRNFALLQCIDGTIHIKAKTGTVSSDKQLKDMNDSDENDPTNNVLDTSADYDIGDNVPFVLTGTVAENFALFQGAYKFIFHDTADPGLTFNNDISVTIDGTAVDGSAYRVETNPGDGETFQVIFDDLRQVPGVHAGSVIEISYTAMLNENAIIGAAGNKNTMHLEYSNNPYDENETGDTPEKVVIVFTYEVKINKVDQDNQPLAGAGFALYKLDLNYAGDDGLKNEDGSMQNVLNGKTYNKLVKMYTDAETNGFTMTEFSFEGIDDGEYLLVETNTPDGYNTIDPVAFKVAATHSGIELTDLNGNPIAGTVELTFTSNAGTGSMVTNVVNKSGSLLPSTGGIGTTMFYIIGGVLIVGACVVLFVRKTMKNEKR